MLKVNRKSFTLIETLISVGIFAVFCIVIYLFFMVGIGSWEIGTARIELQAASRNAMDVMVGELKNTTRNHPTRAITILPPPNNTVIVFYLPETDVGGNVIIDADGEIKWPDDDLDYIKYEYLTDSSQLVRREGDEVRILANNVSNVEFIDASIDGSLFLDELNVALTLEKDSGRQKNLSFSMRATVKLRN